MIVTQGIYDELHKEFIYIPETGLLINKETSQVVGKLQSHGYLITTFLGNPEAVHRIAFFMYHGYLPKEEIDHRNRIKTDNRIANLRDATSSENARNTGNCTTNTSGIKGISWSNNARCWRAAIFYKKPIYIGNFKNFINAVKARHYAEQKFGFLDDGISSPAQEYLNYTEKITFHTNIEFEEESIPKNETIASEWEFFCFRGMKKIDKLAEE